MPGLPSRKETLAIVHKSRYDIFLVLSNFIGFLYFVPNIFSRIIVNSFAILATDPTSLSLSIYIYGIHHWRIFRSSYRKLAWVGFEPTTTEFRSDALTDWAIRPWVQLALRANFVHLLQFHLSVQCSSFISVFAFVSRHIFFKWSLAHIYIYKVFRWKNKNYISKKYFDVLSSTVLLTD